MRYLRQTSATRPPPPSTVSRNRCLLAGCALVTAAACQAAPPSTGAPDVGKEGRQSHPPQVEVARAERRDVPIYLTALGTVTAWQTVTVRPLVEGRLLEVTFTEGQPVHRGDVLARLDPRPFDIALRNAEGALARDKATLENARLNLTRNQALRGDKLVSEQTVTDQAALVAQYAGAVRVDEAALEQARYQREQAVVQSPIDGVTGVRQLDAGNLSRLTDANGLVVVTQLEPAAVLLTLPEHARSDVDAEMRRGSVPVTIYARDNAAPLAVGEVRTIDNQMPQGSGTVRLKALAQNPNHALWPGQFVKARLQLQVLPGALVVPASALQRGADGDYVYVVDAAGKVAQRPVTRQPLVEGATTDPGVALPAGVQASEPPVVLAGGVAPGDVVVTDGQLRLRPGIEVSVAPPVTPAPVPAPAVGAGAGR